RLLISRRSQRLLERGHRAMKYHVERPDADPELGGGALARPLLEDAQPDRERVARVDLRQQGLDALPALLEVVALQRVGVPVVLSAIELSLEIGGLEEHLSLALPELIDGDVERDRP